jgi:AraC-like DNA-binding protein
MFSLFKEVYMPIRYAKMEVENYSDELFQMDFHIHKGPYQIKHCHTWWEIIVVIDNSCINMINEKPYLLCKNQIQLIRPNDLHEIRNYDDNIAIHINVEIRKNMIKSMMEFFDKDFYNKCLSAKFLQPITVNDQTLMSFKKLVYDAQSVYFSNIKERQKFTKQLGMSLLLNILRNEQILLNDVSEEKNIAVKAVNLMKKEEYIMLSVSEICELLKITERHLSRECNQWYNKKPIEIFRNIKLDYACGLLCTSSLSVPFIIEKIGFWNVGYFNRIFKEKYGKTPGVYRKTVYKIE